MILRSEDLKNLVSKILFALDTSGDPNYSETLELKTEGNILYFDITNREYYARMKLTLDEAIPFHATINAIKFLKLISQITTDTIELTTNENTLIVKGNGVYKFPLVFTKEGNILELPKIEISNVTADFNIGTEILASILNYNSKEINKVAVRLPIQKLYYVDEKGAITFTNGACVNNFSLPQPIKILLPNKIVKLFKLFDDGQVNFNFGFDALSDDIIQTKVKFENDCISLTAIISCDDSMLNSVPVVAIRNRASKIYDHAIIINKTSLLEAIKRLLLFDGEKLYSNFHFGKDKLTIEDSKNNNTEELYYENELPDCDYTATLDLLDLKSTLEGCIEQDITMSFGDHQAFVISRGNVYNVIPEVVLN